MEQNVNWMSFQEKMHRTTAALLLLLGLVQGYPTGAPSCTASPGHGQNTGPVTAVVTNPDTNKWKVCKCLTEKKMKF